MDTAGFVEHSKIVAYLPLVLLFLVGAGLAALFYLGATFLGPKKDSTPEKLQPFECGSESTGAKHLKLSVKFYMTAILFVVFDIEAIFIYPWAIQFKTLGWVGLFSMLAFLTAIVVALVYVWRKGALEWET
jgi:NADH-quinone oxidoreductase subunit A